MRLRSLLGLFSIGMAFLPLSIILTFILLFGTSDRDQAPPSHNMNIIRLVHGAVGTDESGNLAAAPAFVPPEGIRLVILDARGTALVSSFPGVPAGTATGGNLSSFIPERLPPGYRVLSDSLTVNGEIAGSYAAIFPSLGTELTSNPVLSFMITSSPIALAILAFGASGIISARIVGAFRKLEKAAVRIAEGDLDTIVSVRGIREISALASAMETMRGALRENLSRRTRFLAGVSHDLRTPLTSIKGFLEAISDGLAEDPETLRRYLSIMEEKADILENRITELLDLARMQTGAWRLRPEDLELKPFLDRLTAEYVEDATAQKRTFSASVRIEAGTVVKADRKMLSRAVENIFTNALRYTPPGSAIVLTARVEEVAAVPAARERVLSASGIILTIEDNGPGIPREELERIFEPYFRGKTSTGEESGLGLGLSIARSIIRDHGWELIASSAPSGGSSFRIYIPLG